MSVSGITTGIGASTALAANAAKALNGLVAVTPQTTVGYQPQGFGVTTPTGNTLLFHYEGEQSVMLESDITDHYIENNTALQDQIALRPETISTHGFIGELNDVAPIVLTTLQTLATALTPVSGYTPVLSSTAILAYNTAFQLYQIATNAISAASSWSTITGQGGEAVVANGKISNTSLLNQTKQQLVFQQFYGYWTTRTLFTVQTPWAVFQNMAIKSLRAVQDAETRMITDFEVTFKTIRIASIATQSSVFGPLPQGVGRASVQQAASNPVNTGPGSTTTSPLVNFVKFGQ